MMLTNYGREEYREATEKLNIVDFLVKPILTLRN
ncbi:MAG: hypothetical protein UV01_C0004G0029 [Parcubacteria group bacterium GW2011_GWA2_42_14]|nr:MAG: hypothetical protein UV01_C0004G0029 [Parcubacteria group bacterium GW2011_GWA2_42_14]